MLSERYANDGVSCLQLNDIQCDQRNRIQGHIKSGKYKFESVNCLICGGNHLEPLSEKDRYGLYMPVAICRDCGLIQAAPRMTEDAYNHFYNDGHRRLYVGSETPDKAYFKERYRAGKAATDYLSKHMDISGKRILEVGCGSGAILKYLHDSGAHVKGIDLSREYLEYGRERYDLDLSDTNLFDLPEHYEFDLVIYSDVLEHILEPRAHLNKIRKLLKPDGLLYLKVPGTKNLIRPYMGDFLKSLQNAHVYYYSLTTLRNLVENCGYSMVHGNEEVRSLWRCHDSQQKTPLKNDYNDCMKILKKLEKKTIYRNMLPVAANAVQSLRKFTSG